ncbi:MAG: M60 family metallopeptidase, partial [Planctomycetota bacterium]
DHFPGSVPEKAERVECDVIVDLRRPRWHSTGLYAPPGEVITVGIPAAAKGAGLVLRVGCHTDSIRRKPDWTRAPEIALRRPLDAARVSVASAFGGLIYVEVPKGAPARPVKLKVKGAVEAPRYVHGETKVVDWQKTQRHLPGPWAELETKKIILSVPSKAVRDLDDPKALMDHWDRVMDACADLAVRPRKRESPERIVADILISVGYMHAGYPIMTHLDAVERMTSLERMQSGDWGLFHELGHNHQHRDWTFNGTVEVTCNLFTLYVHERVCGKERHAISPGRVPAPEKKVRAYLDSGPDFARWKREPFTALTMYVQLLDAFGWDAFTDVFEEYRDLPAAEKPKDDAEKRDQWLERMSRRVKRDLGPFFEAWGVPVSAAARKRVAKLKDWMPEGFPPPAKGK